MSDADELTELASDEDCLWWVMGLEHFCYCCIGSLQMSILALPCRERHVSRSLYEIVAGRSNLLLLITYGFRLSLTIGW